MPRPSRDDEALIQQWNDYGTLNCAEFHANLLDSEGNPDECHYLHCDALHVNRRFMGSDMASRIEDLPHNRTVGSLCSCGNSDSLNNIHPSHINYGNRGEDCSFLSDSSSHKRRRILRSKLRTLQLLSILVMIAFCSSLLMPSKSQHSSQRQWDERKDVHKRNHSGSRIIETEWNSFRLWAGQIGFDEQIYYLFGRMMVDPVAAGPKDETDVQDPGPSEQVKMNDATQDAFAAETAQSQAQERDTSPSGGSLESTPQHVGDRSDVESNGQ